MSLPFAAAPTARRRRPPSAIPTPTLARVRVLVLALAVLPIAAAPAPHPLPSPSLSSSPSLSPAPASTPNPAAPVCVRRYSAADDPPLRFRDCPDAPEIIPLAGGRAVLGDRVGDGQPYEQPVRAVQIAPFGLGRHEVTRGQWAVCVTAGGCAPLPDAAEPLPENLPAARLTWHQAQGYVDWLARRSGRPYRLPSEAEWEYAARAGHAGRYPWGSSDLDACRHLNLADASARAAHPDWRWAEACDDGHAGPAPVGSLLANDWGFHDLLGNVWEWVGDCWHPDYQGAPTDGRVWLAERCRKRVNRGGGFGNNLRAARVSARDADPADARSDGLGFRVALDLRADPLPGGLAATADARAPGADSLLGESGFRPAPQADAADPPALPPPATSLALERELRIDLAAEGTQRWVNGVQHTAGETAQRYRLQTRLRSDGVLYPDNLLDPDPERRRQIKQRFLARQGLVRLRNQQGGALPTDAAEVDRLIARLEVESDGCAGDGGCSTDLALKLAALELLRAAPTLDLRRFVDQPATGLDARYLVFFGEPGCLSRVALHYRTTIAGERAYDRRRRKLVPWSLRREALPGAEAVAAEDRRDLCQRYTVVVDIRSGEVFVENLYLPSAVGTTVRSKDGQVERLTEAMPVVAEALNWSLRRTRNAREQLAVRVRLPLQAPLDNDATVLGVFDGELVTTLRFSFLPVPGAAEARVPGR